VFFATVAMKSWRYEASVAASAATQRKEITVARRWRRGPATLTAPNYWEQARGKLGHRNNRNPEWII